MKSLLQHTKFLLSTIFIVTFLLNLSGQSCNCDDQTSIVVGEVASDGFESYTLNGSMLMSGRWSLYPKSSNYNPVAPTVVGSPVLCGNKSIRFKSNNNQPIDVRYQLNSNRITIFMYVPSGRTANVAFLDGNNNLRTDIKFGNSTSAQIIVNGSVQTSFTYPKDRWFRFSSHTLNAESSALFIDNDNVGFVTLNHANGYLNLYAHAPSGQRNDEFYVDKLCHMGWNGVFISCAPDYDPVCLNKSKIEVGDNSCYALDRGFLNYEYDLCNNGGSGGCDDATPIACGQTVTGTTFGETYKFYRPDYGSCLYQSGSNDFAAPDKVYKFTKSDNTGDIGITLKVLTANVDLDVFLLDECGQVWTDDPRYQITTIPPGTPNNPNIHCIASGRSAIDQNGYDTDFIEYKNLPAGEYYIVVDGQYSPGNFELTLTCKDLNCSNSDPIYCNIPKYNQSMGTANNVSVYCSPPENSAGSNSFLPTGAGCTGKERVYTFNPDFSGPVTITVSGISNNQDLELFLLQNCDHTRCLASSSNSAGQSEVINYNVVAGQTYQIVVDGYMGGNSTFDISVNCCGNPQFLNCSINGPITYYYKGDGNNLVYTFTTTEQIASGYQWLAKRAGGSIVNDQLGSTSTVNLNFNNSGNYEICFPRFNAQGCIEYCCIPIVVENPFNCNNISYNSNTSGNTFSFDAQDKGSYGQWLVDDGSSGPPTVLPGGTIPVPGTCVKRTISYKYYDGNFWRYCCKNIWICNPFTCGNEGNITYSYTNNSQFQFSLQNASQYNQISWQVDDPIKLDIGTGGSAIWYPGTGQDCKTYVISARYWDSSCNCWRICCRSIYVCNPFTCGNINIGYKPSNNQFTFGINNTGGQSNNFNWTLDDTNTKIGSGQQITYIPPGNLNCGKYVYSVRYWDGFTWRICCVPIYICNPLNCGDDIYYNFNNGNLSLSTRSNYNVINWFIDDNPIGNNVNINQGSYNITLLYYDTSLNQYGVCKKSVVLTTSSEDTALKQTRVFPNPTNNNLIVETDMPIKSIKLYDMNSRPLMIKEEQDHVVDLSRFSSGIYILKVETSLGIDHHKIIKIE